MYLEKTLLTADSSKYFKGFSGEKFSKSRSVGIYERDTNSVWKVYERGTFSIKNDMQCFALLIVPMERRGWERGIFIRSRIACALIKIPRPA